MILELEGSPVAVRRSDPAAPDLEDDLRTVLRAMAEAATAAPILKELTGLLGWPEARLMDTLAELEAGGMVEPWEDCPAGIAIMLTNLAADRLRLRLVGGEGEMTTTGRFGLRWLPLGARDRPPKKAARGTAGTVVHLEADLADLDGPALLDSLPDPHAVDPGDHVEAAEFFEGRRRMLADPQFRGFTAYEQLVAREFLRFVHIRGIREIWDGEQTAVVCGSCGNRPLAEAEFCCRCNRSGLDHLTGPPPKLRKDSAKKQKKKAAPAAWKAGQGSEAKRKAGLAAR